MIVKTDGHSALAACDRDMIDQHSELFRVKGDVKLLRVGHNLNSPFSKISVGVSRRDVDTLPASFVTCQGKSLSGAKKVYR
jgi:hypothetical protein